MQGEMQKKTKNILDYVHGMITFDSFYFRFIDTPQFQRLRELYQLSTMCFVFPSAIHSRFEHSLGTGFLSNKLIKILQTNQPELDITDGLIKSISLAGLCHNLGHGPYSFSFTSFLHDKGRTDWNYQAYSNVMLENIIATEGIELENEGIDVNLIKDFILGSTVKRDWTYEIVKNRENGVDVDIFEYLHRDTYKLGIGNQSFDYQILMSTARVIDGHISYRSQDAFSIYELFQCRYALYKNYYYHRVTKGIELMIKDIFAESNHVYHFDEMIDDPSQFVCLSDNIINDIMYTQKNSLDKAKKLVNRIYQRDLYKFIGEIIWTSLDTNSAKFENLNEDDIFNCAVTEDYSEDNLQPGDIRVVKMKLDLGKGMEDPAQYVQFYDNKSNYSLVNVSKDEISHLIPSKFQELILRVYVTDKKKCHAAKIAFNKFCKENDFFLPGEK